MRDRIHLLLIISFILGNSLLAQKYSIKETPDWVTTVDTNIVSQISKYDVISGYYVSLVDYQINLAEDAYFIHDVTNVVSFSGITNASQLAVSYDTSYQELEIHYLYIWRNGNKIDRTREFKLEILNNEQNLYMGIYTGQITAYSILEDIRKDDQIDFAYTLIGNNPIFREEKYLFYPLESLNPIDHLSVRIIYPLDSNYIFKCVGCEDEHVSRTIWNNFQQIKIENFNTTAIDLEDFMPTWLIPYNYFMLSSMHSWEEVNEWAEWVFDFEETQNLDEVYKEVFTGEENMDEKIDKLIHYVQNEIRYMGIESGIGSIKPFHPEQVVKQRFGDCKDKSLLLVSLLKQTGIEVAYPALVNSMMENEISNFLPGVQVFDHCIVCYEYNDTTYWVDPAIPQQGGNYKNLFNYDYGRALIVGLPADTLQKMNSLTSTNSHLDVIEEYTIKSFFEPADLKIVSVRYGMEADQRRSILEYYSTKEISDLVTDDLGRQFPVVEQTEEIKFEDDIQENVFTTTYSYQVDGFWIDGDKSKSSSGFGMRLFRYEPVMLFDYFDVESCNLRIYPMAIDYPTSLNFMAIFHFPDKILIDDDIDIFENDAFYYEERVEQINSNTVQIGYKLKTLTKEVSAENYLEICKQKKEIKKDLPVVFYFLK